MIKEFLAPIPPAPTSVNKQQIGKLATIYSNEFPKVEGADIALIGIREERGCVNNHGTVGGPDAVRKALYQLYGWEHKVKFMDLGDINMGRRLKDTYAAVTVVCGSLLKKGVIPIFIGGSHDLALSQFLGYGSRGNLINLVDIDEKIDFAVGESKLDASSFLSSILDYRDTLLLSFQQLGYQNYLVDQDRLDASSSKDCEFYRLGRIRENIEEVEPLVRDADMLTLDVGAIRQSDAPARAQASPNGFYGEEICQIMRYAGLSDRLSSLGIFELNPDFDEREQTSQLVAQMIWCFVDGFVNRKKDDPNRTKRDFIRYTVNLKEQEQELVFLKSKKTDRWWMQVPFEEHQQLIPCSFNDYELACSEEIPERYLKAYHKLN